MSLIAQWLGFRDFTMHSKLTHEQALLKLALYVHPPQPFPWIQRGGKYQGTVDASDFRVKVRYWSYRGVVPLIKGKVIPSAEGSVIKATVKPALSIIALETAIVVNLILCLKHQTLNWGLPLCLLLHFALLHAVYFEVKEFLNTLFVPSYFPRHSLLPIYAEE